MGETPHPRQIQRVAGRFGKAAPQFPQGLKEFGSYLKAGAALPSPPNAVDHFSAVSTWPMDGNDQYGDCTLAAAAHAIQLWNQVTGRNDPLPSLPAIVAEYFKLTGGADTGLVEANVLKVWRKSGLWQNKIVGYAPVNVHDQTLLQQAIYLYGLAYVGIQVPANAQTQFEAGQPWSLVPGWQQQKIVGGHAIPLVGYDANFLYAVTWGQIQKIGYDWWQTYADEAWAILPQEFKEAGGFDQLDFQALLADLKQI